MTKQTIADNQMSFADLGLIDPAPASAVAPAPKKKSKPAQQKASHDIAPADAAVVSSLKSLLAHAEHLGLALQEKYEANLNADRIVSRVGISVDIEEVEGLLVAISEANNALGLKN